MNVVEALESRTIKRVIKQFKCRKFDFLVMNSFFWYLLTLKCLPELIVLNLLDLIGPNWS